jgi:hypothetical protein
LLGNVLEFVTSVCDKFSFDTRWLKDPSIGSDQAELQGDRYSSIVYLGFRGLNIGIPMLSMHDPSHLQEQRGAQKS